MATNENNQQEEQLTDHEYDGIQEFDNPTPGWWTFIFVCSCVFSIFYFVFFHMGQQGWSIHEAYETDVADNLRLQFADIGELEHDASTLLQLIENKNLIPIGKAAFKGNCVSCHGADGSGLVGPNLTDDHWKNVRKIGDILEVVNNGAANGAMPGWKTRLHPNEIVLVSAYVASLRGQFLTSKRGSEGELIPPWGQEETSQ